MKRIDLEELKKNDGTQDRPAYVATGGAVWDVSTSKMWKNGRHMNSHAAGQDLSVALEAAPHGDDVLTRFEQVGELVRDKPDRARHDFPVPSPLVRQILDQHPHPISAHFPIGLGITAAGFAALSLLLDVSGLSEAAFYNLLVAAVAAPACIAAGVLSWYYNYGGIWTPMFRGKAWLSGALLAVVTSAIALRILLPEQVQSATGAVFWAYCGLMLLVAPIVASIGRLGGKITFPG